MKNYIWSCTLSLLFLACTAAHSQSLDSLTPGRYKFTDPGTGKVRTYYVTSPGGTKLDPTLTDKPLPEDLIPEAMERLGLPKPSVARENDQGDKSSVTKPGTAVKGEKRDDFGQNSEAKSPPKVTSTEEVGMGEEALPSKKGGHSAKSKADRSSTSASRGEDSKVRFLTKPFSLGRKTFKKIGSGFGGIGKGIGAANDYFFGSDTASPSKGH